MQSNILIEKVMKENINIFSFKVELKELSTNGVVRFYSKKCDESWGSYWNNKKLTIPVSGVYQIDWGFCQNSISAYYKNSETELALVINNRLHSEKAKVTKANADVDSLNYCRQTLTTILEKNDTLSLCAKIFNPKSLNMKDVYLKVVINN
ncbi:hypothetical protein [Polaribacter sargassicola]|uniref:hypothetical protein n=1 Tax=Polaribacter sargassicola TaxID=2836891 RepID=UPI001F440ED4|nr:hypothetical protein [Polaribacter sp. DS7-9]MCG1034858.1 hypothetical protein [Polaribacter sp. DS7-9]